MSRLHLICIEEHRKRNDKTPAKDDNKEPGSDDNAGAFLNNTSKIPPQKSSFSDALLSPMPYDQQKSNGRKRFRNKNIKTQSQFI